MSVDPEKHGAEPKHSTTDNFPPSVEPMTAISPDPATPTDEAAITHQSPPNGGLKAWLCVLGAFLCQFCSFGFLNA